MLELLTISKRHNIGQGYEKGVTYGIRDVVGKSSLQGYNIKKYNC
jgi:hypothetical protein